MIRRIVSPRHVTNRNARIGAALAVIAAIAAFFGYEFRYLSAPTLKLALPQEDAVVDRNTFDVRGRTDPDADVTLNGRPLFVGPDGAFEERILLARGLNRIDLEAKNRYGKMTSVTRHLILP